MGKSADTESIQRKLQARQARRGVVYALLMLFGLPLMLLGPLVLGSMFWLACLLLFHWYPWTWFFLGACCVVIPVLMMTEIQTHGGFMSEAISAEESRRAQTGQAVRVVGTLINPRMGNTLALAAAVAAPRASMAGFIELFLAGPRMVLGALRGFQVRGKLRGTDVERAATLLLDLKRATAGVPVRGY